MSRQQARDAATGAALVGGGGGLLAAPWASGALVNRGHRAYVNRQMVARTGTLGGLTAQGQPVNPFALSGKRGGKTPEGRRPSPRVAAAHRFAASRAPFEARLARPPVRGRTGLALWAGQSALGVGALYAGGNRIGRAIAPNEHGVRKDFVSSQDLVGIPPWRQNPVDPLTMHASSSIMADILVGASGRNLTRRQKKRIRGGAYRFVGAQHLVVVPTGMQGLVTS